MAAVGLTQSEAENAFARAMVDDGLLTADDIDLVNEEKRQVIRKSGMLDFVTSSVDLGDVGGLENLKKWLDKRNNSWLDIAKTYNIPSPKGVLITGVPGCGKSLTAKAVAASWGLPLLRMDVGRIFAGLIGSSEQNMRLSIRTAEAIAPCVLWIDEVEKGFGGGRGESDGGTSARVFGTFLTWLQEKSSSVFVVATANNVDRLPAEFLRKGRFDEIFFVDLPTFSERRQVWRLQLEKRLTTNHLRSGLQVSDELLNELAAETDDFSGAEIEQAVIAALFDAFTDRRALLRDDLIRAVRTTVPLSTTQSEQIAILRDWANSRAVSASSTTDLASQALTGIGGDAAADQATRTRGGRAIDI
jgi:SpoVK/Ycf46/Vps4 family AAA+-type ATPase